jgi:hypothetical protein
MFRIMFVFGRLFMYVYVPFMAFDLMYLEYLSHVKKTTCLINILRYFSQL